jgi:GNAT superfamily N-acetyltransferase
MPEMRIVKYRPSHRRQFAELVDAVHAELGFAHDPVLDADLDAPSEHYRHILLLTKGHTVVGSAALTAPSAGVVTLKRMYLRPAQRKQGWGRRLLDALIRCAENDGCVEMRLDTTERQHAACRLYEAAGFEIVRQEGETLHYAKRLDAAGKDAVLPPGVADLP